MTGQLAAPVVAPMVNYFGYLLDGANWHLSGDSSIPSRLGEHLLYTVVALLISAAIALPLGLLIGHTDRGAFLAIGLGNLGRSLPTFGLVLLLITWRGIGFWPLIIGLVVLAVPPILAQTYAGIRSVDRSAVDAAIGMGMRPAQVLFRAEVPMALPLISSGLRSALLQVTATATVAAYAGVGGLGRLLVDGLNRNEYDQIFAGAVLVALLAVVLDYLSAGVERAVVSPGVRERRGRRTRRSSRAAAQRTPSDPAGPPSSSSDENAVSDPR
jgi:osmoprotectant transport system permease protein